MKFPGKRRSSPPPDLPSPAAAAVVLLVLKAAGPISPAFGRKDFNVILITVDTLRADKIGCYGNRLVATPAMDALAARGIRFESASARRR